jgi:hypothetical protein
LLLFFFLPLPLSSFRWSLRQPVSQVKRGGLFPTFEQLEKFSHLMEAQNKFYKFSVLIEKFVDLCRVDTNYFICDYSSVAKLATLLGENGNNFVVI